MKIKMSRKKWIAVLASLAVILAVFKTAVALFNKSSPSKQIPDEADAAGDGTVDAWGEVIYLKSYDINVDFPSVVKNVFVQEGDRVKKGDPLVELDVSEYGENVKKLEQQLLIEKAKLPTVTQDASSLKADILDTKNDIARKKAELDNGSSPDLVLLVSSQKRLVKEVTDAKQDLSDYESFYKAGAASKETVDQYADILNQKEKALSDVNANLGKTKTALRDELDKLNVLLKSKEAQFNQIITDNAANSGSQKSSVLVSELNLNQMLEKTAKEYIKDGNIVSCTDNGIVRDIKVVNGSRLGYQGAPTSVLKLIDADTIIVRAEVHEEFIEKVRLGEKVSIVPVSDDKTSIPGTVTQISDYAFEKDGNRIVYVQVKPDDKNGFLKPGFTADVYFPA
ncbi:MAG: efflux RND transporter periplasmic adaptor subunit [Bacillota bacterium]|nr:efflux RND transporter periplasmic adaptor subunit [Bacillota bacterium]